MITADKETSRKLLKEYVINWQALIDVLPYPVSIHAVDFTVVTSNKMFDKICGKADVIGMKCHQLIHCKDIPVEDCPMERTLKSGTEERAEIHEPMLKKHIIVQTSPVFIEDKLVGVVHSVTDITAIKESEIHYKDASDMLEQSLTDVKEKERSLQKSRDAFLNMLEDITESYRELEDLFIKTVVAMVNALDAKSPWTKGHTERVTNYALEIAREIGLEDDAIEHLRLCCLLHDIGKIGIYDAVLDKPGKLTDEEFELIKKHPEKGAEILRPIKQLNKIIPGILHHHERYDGKGYPDGLMGEDIPLCARILHVADSFDSMTADRPYRPAPGVEYAVSEFKKHAGFQFDPLVVEAFMKILKSKGTYKL